MEGSGSWEVLYKASGNMRADDNTGADDDPELEDAMGVGAVAFAGWVGAFSGCTAGLVCRAAR